ncbi:MAG: polyketide cyclase [Pseudoxanthomonas sp.]
MTRVLEFLIALALVLALFLLIGVVLPSKRHLEESVETNRKMSIVFDTVNNVRRLKDWNSLLPSDPARLQYSGGADGRGVGAQVSFSDPGVAAWSQGSWKISANQVPPAGGGGSVTYAVIDNTAGSNKQTTYSFTPTGTNNRNVRITQRYDVDYGWNLLGRYQGMYVARQVGDGIKASLTKLTNNLATIPNVDYRVEGSGLGDLSVVDAPAEDLLVVTAGNIDRDNDKIKASIKSNQEWIKRVADANNLEPVGAVRIITTDLGQDKYAFDVAQPVRKRNGPPPKDDAKPGDKKDEPAPADDTADASTASAGLLNVKIPDGAPVKYVHVEPHRSAFTTYSGHMAGLENARAALRAWAMTNGYDVTERPYEAYKAGVDKSFSTDGKFDVYWQIK